MTEATAPSGRWWTGVATGGVHPMLTNWHVYACYRCQATLSIGGALKDVMCPGCDELMAVLP
jgi:PHP family Zn ribbon phosphoesterase